MTSFEPANAQRAFMDFLQHQGAELETLGVPGGIAAMLDFYAKDRAKGCPRETDADMLLFQWGTYDWGQGRQFYLDLTRQLIIGEDAEDDDIWQLNLSFGFEPSDVLVGLGNGDKWCASLDELVAFRDYVLRSEPYAAVARLPATQVKLEYDCAG